MLGRERVRRTSEYQKHPGNDWHPFTDENAGLRVQIEAVTLRERFLITNGADLAAVVLPIVMAKHQIPTSKLQGTFNQQIPKQSTDSFIGCLRLELLWMLELGIWSFSTKP
jgi:hypothetical protein